MIIFQVVAVSRECRGFLSYAKIDVIAGAKEALWFFAERQLDARLVWSPGMHGKQFDGWQPESLTDTTREVLARS